MSNQTMEIREAPNGEWQFSGYASVTGREYPMAGYTEVIAAGSFRETLSENPDVRLLFDHAGPPLARTPKTLSLLEDDIGLRVSASLDSADPEVRALKGRIARGDIREMSFAFVVKPGGQRWDSDFTRREITNVSIASGDVSIVGAGANPYTTVSISERASDMTLEQRRLRAETIGQELRAATPNVGLGDERRNAMLDHEAEMSRVALHARVDRLRHTSPLVDGDGFEKIKASYLAKVAAIRAKDAQRSADTTFERRLADERAATEHEARQLGMRGFGGTADNYSDAQDTVSKVSPDDDDTLTTVCPECGAHMTIELPPDDDADDVNTAAGKDKVAEDALANQTPFYNPATDGQPLS